MGAQSFVMSGGSVLGVIGGKEANGSTGRGDGPETYIFRPLLLVIY